MEMGEEFEEAEEDEEEIHDEHEDEQLDDMLDQVNRLIFNCRKGYLWPQEIVFPSGYFRT